MITDKQYRDLCEQVAELGDRLRNGIEYNADLNCYVLIWTKREVEKAKEKAAKLREELKWDDA